MKKIVMTLLLFLFMGQPVVAADIYGIWATQKKEAEITIKKCGASICGNITAGSRMKIKDIHNEDPKLRARTMKGLQLFRMNKTDNPKRWEGKLYNPQDGKTYAGVLKYLSDNKAKLEGCFLFICLGETWTRIK